MAEVRCPYCGETIDIAVDAGGQEHQEYVEDCSVCCRPIVLSMDYRSEDDDFSIRAEREGG
jgi:hypothetical protein